MECLNQLQINFNLVYWDYEHISKSSYPFNCFNFIEYVLVRCYAFYPIAHSNSRKIVEDRNNILFSCSCL